jgi:predicted RNase H-like HicB family nuclease
VAESLKYVVLIEKGKSGYGAWVPDLPGCVATGRSERVVRRRIASAIELHLRAMREDGDPIPPPNSIATTVEVAA